MDDFRYILGDVPEPSSYALRAVGVGFLGFATSHKRKLKS